MSEKNINTEEMNVDQLLKALTFEGEREIKSTHTFPPFLFTKFHVFHLDDESKKKLLEETKQLKEMHEEDKEVYGNMLLSSYLYHLTDLPRELVSGNVLGTVLNKPNRQFSLMISSVIEEVSEVLSIDMTQFESWKTVDKAKKLG